MGARPAVDEEQLRRLSREIHELGQTLTTIGLLCRALKNQPGPRSEKSDLLLGELAGAARQAILQGRGLKRAATQGS